MKKIILSLLALAIFAPMIAIASEHKCDCHAKDLTEECKKECEHH